MTFNVSASLTIVIYRRRIRMKPFPVKVKARLSRRVPFFSAGRRATASGGPAWRSGPAGSSDPRSALASGESHAAAGGSPLQTQQHHLLYEAQVDPHALEARQQGRLRRGDGEPGGETEV